jgi:alkanesulfonate monooxygenase SsuD/methylene tetrahydromethanopterin reductase-like flavin-dependent oxidoreductase (luciferase family)
MKFGIFYELQLPRPWQAGDEFKLYQDALTQLETADRLGYDHAWVVEHHFLEEYSHSPSPESFLAPPASAPRTSGSATAFSSSPPIIPPASPSASRCSIS